MGKPKIILYDVETAPATVASFTLYPNNGIHHSNILEDWYIITICWKELGAKKVNSISVLDDPKRFKKDPHDDYYVISEFRKVLSEADAVIGQNIKSFDTRVFNTRLIYHKLPPVPPVPEIDTLKLWKKITKSMSNRLDYVGKFLGFGGKLPTSEGLWIRALKGEPSAIREMIKYCKIDVEKLEEFYKRIVPYVITHPHIGAMLGVGKESCPKCGSTSLTHHKFRYTATGIKKQQLQCRKCGSYVTLAIKK
jgi:ribosomal protein S27AE